MTYVGEIAHELPGRVRIKVSAGRGDAAFFDRLAREVASTPNIVEVQANARACSLTVRGDGGGAPVRAVLEQAGLFEFRAPAPAAPKRGAIAAKLAMKVDLNSALAVLLGGLGVFQVARGQVTGGASENFWNAYRAQGHLRNTAAALALTTLGVMQLVRGQYLNSASSLLFYALTARHLAREQAVSGPGRPARPAR